MLPLPAAIQPFVDQIRAAAADQTPLQIRGGGSKDFYGCLQPAGLLDTRSLSGVVDYAPSELVVTVATGTPLSTLEAKIRIPDYAGPVQLQSLDLELRGNVLHETAGPDVLALVKEPMHGIHLGSDVDGMGFESVCLGGDNNPESLAAARTILEPFFCSTQVAGYVDRISAPHFGQRRLGFVEFEVKHLTDKSRKVLGSEGTHRDCQVQSRIENAPATPGE